MIGRKKIWWVVGGKSGGWGEMGRGARVGCVCMYGIHSVYYEKKASTSIDEGPKKARVCRGAGGSLDMAPELQGDKHAGY